MNAEDSELVAPKMHKEPERFFEYRSKMYHTLMPFKVREILIVSSLYDAFVIEQEGLISELVVGQYQHHLLSSPPRVTRVYSGERALSKLKEYRYDLVITMSKNIGMDPFEFGKKIKKLHPRLPVILLATDTADINLVQERDNEKDIDKVFFWTGDSTLFLAIIKYVEDSINAKYDTKNGNVRVMIMVEDSIHHYSMFLPIIYTEIVRQTSRSLSEDLNEIQRLLRRRARPKILLAENYEKGMELYEQYKDYVLGIISDIHFKKNGKLDPEAGYKLVKQIKEESKYVPILMQSSNPENREKSENIGAFFLDKNSPTLLKDFEHFLLKHLGFGDFIFRLPECKKKIETVEHLHKSTTEIAQASNMQEFEQALQKIPLESIQFHSDRNDFSNWLLARGEFKAANELRPKKSTDFTDLDEVRKHLVSIFNESRREKQLGVITDFSQQKFEFDGSFTRIRGDSLGGKGRGIAFMRSILTRYNLDRKYPDVNISVPSTVVIGTLEFDRFIKENNLIEFTKKQDLEDKEIAKAFLAGKICAELKDNLATVLKHFKKPLAVRSSSLLEDSQSRPFAGIFSTYMLPNNHKNNSIRLGQLCQAVKLIYASVYYKEPRAYIESTSSKIEEEKMAVIIQELIGTDYNGRLYPTFSGVAQSYNFYPVGHQTFEDGIASVAVGLGKTVVGGEKSLRFCPRYPSNIPEMSSPKLIFESAQRELYVLDTTKKNINLAEKDDVTLKKINIDDIKTDSSLDLVVSTFDKNDGMIRAGVSDDGPSLVTFANILKYDAFPLASILRDVLDVGQGGMGSPVEIEFAVNFDNKGKKPPTFSILQLRPLVPSHERCEIAMDDNISKDKIFIRSKRTLGNGIIKSVKDIVYVAPETFDNTKTVEIAEEIGQLNKQLLSSVSPYLLIGPGRWGTEDRFLGIPVKWNQISGVRVMVETALKDFNIEPSQGTHFFHNITSRGIGYLNIPYKSSDSFIDWDWLNEMKPVKKLKYVKHVKLTKSLNIKLNGRTGCSLIEKQ